MSAKSAMSALDAAIDAANGTAAPKSARATVNVQNAAADQRVIVVTDTTVKNGATKSSATKITVDGFDITYSKGAVDEKLIKAVTSRETKNVWYPVVVAMAERAPDYLEIRRSNDSTAKSPVASLRSAVGRAWTLDVPHVGKLAVKSSTEKGVWYLIHRP